jgi:predicted transcriptional regulator
VFPSEMVILLSIALSSASDKTLISRPVDGMNEYIGYLYTSLVGRGFLRENGSKRYKLTSKGNEALLKFLDENRSQAESILKALHLLGVESSHKVEELGKEVIGVKEKSKTAGIGEFDIFDLEIRESNSL